jgi:hypothetical protein
MNAPALSMLWLVSRFGFTSAKLKSQSEMSELGLPRHPRALYRYRGALAFKSDLFKATPLYDQFVARNSPTLVVPGSPLEH